MSVIVGKMSCEYRRKSQSITETTKIPFCLELHSVERDVMVFRKQATGKKVDQTGRLSVPTENNKTGRRWMPRASKSDIDVLDEPGFATQ